MVEVDKNDPAFENPTKPIGSFLDEADAKERMAEGKTFVEDAGRGWRQVVPSPKPKRIVEVEADPLPGREWLHRSSVGGGGIPVVENEDGDLVGIEAVIDKDFASALLAETIISRPAADLHCGGKGGDQLQQAGSDMAG